MLSSVSSVVHFNSKVYEEKYAKLLKGCIFSPVVVCNGKTDDQKLDDYMNHIKTPIMSCLSAIITILS